ncbi:uncharacterized protein [Haliotis cracherodii]|uniref:uncharacterized protein n=1 Tax=Haliotis cracherodii TaxID=6455 RepID=UPI0039EC5988
MATSQKLTEHYLTCVICSDVFTNPCTLVCNHTFCRKCVVNYTKTRPEAISAKSLLCPFCNTMTKVSAPERPVEGWADDVKPSFVIQGLLDSFGPGSKDTTNCSYCIQEGETTPASVWCYVCDDALCGRCVRVHNRIPATRHHDLTDLSGEVKVKRRRTVMCKEHTDESIKLLCKDCKKALCQTCCTIYHRKCESVVSLGVEIRAMKAVLTQATGNLSRRKDEISKEIETKKSKLEEETCRFKQMESDINSATVKAIERIKLREKDLLDQLKEMSDKHLGQLKADIKSGEMSVQMYQQQAELIDQTLQSECDMDVYEMYQGCAADDADAELKKRGRIARVTFTQDTDKLSKSLDDLQLGEIDVLYEGVLNLKATPVSQDTINVRVAGDESDVRPFDVTEMVVNGIDTVVVTDQFNHSVKSFYTRNNQQGHSKLLLGGYTWGITKLTHNQVAVTVPNINQIVTVEVNPDLELLSTITTSKQYWGITSLTPSTLAASSPSPPCVDILDMTGNVLRSISPRHNGNNILQCPNFLCTTRTRNILVSDSGARCVVCLTPKRDVVFTYSPTGDTALKCPQGITSTSTGDILVTDLSLHRVIHLTESGQFVKHLLTSQDSIQKPSGIYVNMATSQKLTEHYLTCVICSDVFTNPCTLVCNHTFCRKCVVNYTKTRPEAIRAKSLLCPYCNKMTKVSAPERPVEEWADDVNPIFVIQGLLDAFGPASKDTTNCSYCKVEGETTPASVWCYVCDDALCGRCVKVHSLIPATRHHDVTDLSGEVKVKRRRTVMCKEHTDESIKLLCKDCKKAVCQTCCTIYHRKCESVVSLGVEIRAMKAVLTRATGNLSRRKDEISKEIETKKSKLEDETCRFKQMESDINSATVKAIERIKLREKDLLDQLREMSDEHLGQLKAGIKLGEMSVQMYQQQAELIDQALQSECDMDVYEMYQGCEAGDVEAVGDADLKETERIAMVRQDTDKLSKSLHGLQLGEIDVLYEGVLDLKATPVLQDTTNALDLTATPVLQDTTNELDLTATPVLQDTTNVHDLKATPMLQDTINLREMKATRKKDTQQFEPLQTTPVLRDILYHNSYNATWDAVPWDVVVIVANGIDTVVVTDHFNHSVDSFYTRNNQQGHSELLLGGSPLGITKLTHNQVAVTAQGANQIVTVEVNPDLVLLSTITTSKEYWGITSLTPSTLAASSQSPCVDILDMAGNVLRSICPLQKGHDILQRPDFLCTTRTGNILVSDNGSQCVMCLTPEGNVVFEYSPTGYTGLVCPYGITCASTGDILVADHSKCRVIYLTERGKFVKELMTSQDYMSNPLGMCTDEKGRMYVCQMYGVIQTFLCGN